MDLAEKLQQAQTRLAAQEAEIACLRTQVEMRHRQADLQQLLDNTPALIYLKDMDGRYRFINRQWAEVFHTTYNAIIGKTDLDIFPEDIACRLMANDQHVLQSGESLELEEEAPLDDGMHSYRSIKVALKDSQGIPYALCGISVDITERKQMENAVYFVAQRGWAITGEEFFSSLVTYLATTLGVDYALIGKLLPDGETVESVAFSATGHLGTNFQYVVHNTPCENVIGKKLCLYPVGIQQLFPHDSLLVDMQVESYAGMPLWNSSGQPIGVIEIFSRHPLKNTGLAESLLRLFAVRASAELERRQGEAALNAANDAMAVQLTFFSTLLETLPHPFFYKDAAGRYLGGNTLFAEAMGIPLAELPGKTVDDVAPPELAAVYHVQDDALFQHPGRQQYHAQVQYADGVVHEVIFSKATFTKPDGSVGGLLGIMTDITELIGVQHALQERETRYRTLYTAITDAILVFPLTPAGHPEPFTEVNDVACRQLGYSHDELSRMTIAEIDAPVTDGGTDPRPIIEKLHTGEDVTFEQVQIRKDGSRVPVEIHAQSFTDQDKRWIIALQRNITERKLAEAKIQRTSAQLTSMLESISDAFFSLDNNLVLRYFNAAAERILKLTRDEVLGRYLFDVFPEALGSISDIEYHRAVREKTTRTFETYFPVEPYAGWYSVRVYPQEEGITVYFQNITERKEAEMALERERALLTTGIDILPFPLIFATASGEILRANHAAHGLYPDGTLPNLASSPPIKLLEPATRSAVPEAEWPECRALRGEVIAAAEYLLVLPDGRETPVLVQAAPIYVKDELIGVVMALQDISKLKAADAAKDQFLMVLSHELKTPLTSILGWAHAALSLPDQTQQALGVIVRNAQEQSRILNDLLDVSSLVTGRLTLHTAPNDLWELAASSVESLLPSAQARNLTLHTEPPSASLLVMADAGRLRQAINNLLTNAIKFTEPGGQIWVRAYQRHAMAILEVQDTGRGIAADDLPRLFQPFLQLRREEQKGGLGMGLSLVKGIIELHGGHVEVASPGPGQGSTFTVALPML